MRLTHQHLLAVGVIACTCFMPLPARALAPVVDDSENFALLDSDSRGAQEQPLAHESSNNNNYNNNNYQPRYSDNQAPIAHEMPPEPNKNAALLDEIKSLQQDVQDLRGQLDVQNHQLSQMRENLAHKNTPAPIQPAIKPQPTLKAAPPVMAEQRPAPKAIVTPKVIEPKVTETPKITAAPKVAEAPKKPHGNPADEQISYLAAYDFIKSKKYDKALTALSQFTTQYPEGGYTANAHYWLGELYLIKSTPKKAIAEFDIVLKKFPSSNKAAVSTLKIGYALVALGQMEDAKVKLKEVVKNYPDTLTAQLATAKLESLKA